MTTHPDHMTGADLQTLREACHLTREDLAQLAGVQARTVKHWERGRAGVPADVAGTVQRLDETIEQATRQALATVADMLRAAPQPPADLALMRYHSADDLARFRPDMAGLPAGAHAAIVARVRQGLRSTAPGVPVRVVWMEPDAYDLWRTVHQRTDSASSPASLGEWAALEVLAQAKPHRADQPPGPTRGV